MRIGRFFRPAEADRDQLEQIESYIQIETDEKIARGIPADEARAAARRKFGNSVLVREEIYGMNSVFLFDTLARNIRYGWRTLRRNPVFTAAIVLTLAIGIGANTAVFSVVNHVVLKPLPYHDAGRLVAVAHSAPGAAGLGSVSGDLLLSESMFATYAEKNRTFQAIGIWVARTMTVTGVAEPEQVRAALGASRGQVLANFWPRVFCLPLWRAIGSGCRGASLRLLRALDPGNLPRLNEISLDWETVGFTIVVSLLSGLLFGLIPMKYAGLRISINLRADGR
jgi:hypothetical protein